MDGSVSELSPRNTGTPKRRNACRKLVQSTLFPHKTQETDDKAEEKDEKNCRADEKGEEEVDCCASENKKKRKSKAKVTPQTKSSKQQNSTPKKKLSANGHKGVSSQQMLADLAQISMPVPDLRLEAKMSAEENSRMFAGRQIHPFFSSCKVGKKFPEPAESERSLCTVEKKDEVLTTSVPIHVFENIQDDKSSMDWKNWTFLGETTNANCVPESSISSVLEGSVEPLNFDKLPRTLNPHGASCSQNASSCSDQLSIQPPNLQEILPEKSAVLASGQTTCCGMLEAKVDLEVDEISIFSGQAGFFRKLDTEPQSRFLQESMRPYYHSCEDKAEGSLWSYKYKPTKAFEVCGNDESVNFLRDWLHLWHERRYKSRKDSSNRDKSDMQSDNDDYDCSHCDYDSEDINEEDSLLNVLLITGPIGSGKSAAVYACAQEEGFEVIELNASDCRSGTVVKQYFGDTLGSRGFKRLSEHTVNSQKKKRKLSPGLALPSNKAADELNEGVIELIPISDDEAHSPSGTSRRLLGKRNVIKCDKVQTLILVEDVDILFPEDRGCIAAIQHIAETAKGPIILTSNSNNPGLPDNFNRLHVSFSLPSPKELLCHLYAVCVTERVNIHPLVLEKFIQSCDGDIRKTIMHLQFWFQNKRSTKDRKARTVYGSLPFDLEVGHQILPKIMPWDFPSQLSELIEKEVTASVTRMEENSSLEGLVEEELDINERQNDSDVQHMGTDYIEAKKEKMLERNGSVIDCSELKTQFHAISEFSNSSGTPVASSKRKVQRKLVVMSSDSEDENLNNGHPLDLCSDANKVQSLENKNKNDSPSEFPLNQNYGSPSFLKMGCSGLEDSEEEHCKYSGTDDKCLNETSKSFDISSVPESTFVPETVIVNGRETMSGAVSCGHLADPIEVSVNNELLPFTFGVCKRLAKLSQNDDLLVSTEIPESSQKEVVQDFLDENMETTPLYNAMDECSRVDFKLKSKFVEPTSPTEKDLVQKLWRELRDSRTDLRHHATTEQPGAFQVVKLACRMSNLISEADLFCNYQQKQCDILEPPMLLSDEATFSWYDEQMMMSTVAEHGFCFYAKHLSDIRSKLGCENRVDLTSEMLASTTNVMALGNLSRQELTERTNFYSGKELEVKRNDLPKSEIQTSLFNVIQSIVPARLSLALKGVAFSEYLSSLRQISRSEAFRISQGVEKMRRRRVRGAQHYLSRGTMMLSPEDISLLCEGVVQKNFFPIYWC